MTIYDELVQGQSQLYAKESAVQTEREMLGERLKQNEWMYQKKTAEKAKSRAGTLGMLANALKYISFGYDEWKNKRDLEKSFEEMSKDPEYGKNMISKEEWSGLPTERKYELQYDWEQKKKQTFWDKYYQGQQTQTSPPSYETQSAYDMWRQ
jgi:hypothetical protein